LKKNIAIIGTNGLPGNYGGWDQLIKNITLKLGNDFNFTVYTGKTNLVDRIEKYNGAKIRYVNLNPNGFQSIFYDFFSMVNALNKSEIYFVCGISGTIFFPFFRLLNKKIILNPDGIEWKRKKFSFPAKLFLKVSEKIGLMFSSIIISDNLKIKEYIKKKYGYDSELIEYGGDHVLKGIKLSEKLSKKYGIIKNEYAFKVCRIEPENNIELILKSFSLSKMKLIIIGNWDNSSFGIKMKFMYKDFDNIQILDPIYDQHILDQLRSNCKCYIHGHSVGGTNPSLVEAMSLGLCIFSYDVIYNRETTENSALYFSNQYELEKLIKNKELNFDEFSKKMLNIARNKYTWDLICNKYHKIFKSC
jgi:glycosyltransferase involved in cell wall biosynthesis